MPLVVPSSNKPRVCPFVPAPAQVLFERLIVHDDRRKEGVAHDHQTWPDGSGYDPLVSRLCTSTLASGGGRQAARSGEAGRACRLQASGYRSRDEALGRRLRRIRLEEQHNARSRKQ
jgi:hypothetical protein